MEIVKTYICIETLQNGPSSFESFIKVHLLSNGVYVKETLDMYSSMSIITEERFNKLKKPA